MCTLNPKIDIVFKKLFGSEENKHILKALINAVIEPECPIEELEIKNPYNLADYLQGKNSILDIKVKDEKKRWFDVEMQIGEQGFYGKRAVYYAAKVYIEQIQKGSMYMDLNPTIGIHLLDFVYFQEDQRYWRCCVFKDKETNEIYENMQYLLLYFLEMTKFEKKANELSKTKDYWMYFFNKAYTMSKGKVPQEFAKQKILCEAVEKLGIIFLEKEERDLYEEQQKQRMNEQEERRTVLEKIRIAEEKARTEGRIEGEIKGEIKATLGIKWGEEGLAWMEKIREVKEIEKLNSILSLVKKAKTMAELEKELKKLV